MCATLAKAKCKTIAWEGAVACETSREAHIAYIGLSFFLTCLHSLAGWGYFKKVLNRMSLQSLLP